MLTSRFSADRVRSFMKTILVLLLTAFVGIGLLATVHNVSASSIPHRRIVVFSENVDDQTKESLIVRAGGQHLKHLRLINAASVLLSEAVEQHLRDHPEIKRIDDDVIVTATRVVSQRVRVSPTPTPQPAQVLPWGIDRIEADQAWATTSGAPVKVAIIDTGIQLNHPDLAANIKGGVNTIYPWRNANDDNGHGTHVAGTVAAINNSIGVVGVGPQISLYAVKVLGANGSGYLSDVIEGLDWAIANGMQVVNMSLGTSADIQSFHDAVARVHDAGIVDVAAAGNTGGAVDFPGAYPEVISVAAVQKNSDGSLSAASFTSRGPEVDLSAPGVSILSTYKGNTYATLSGTSMASPHVAGTAALTLTTSAGAYDVNGNGHWDPDEVETKLTSTAENIGLDTSLFGAGLVRADKAVQ